MGIKETFHEIKKVFSLSFSLAKANFKVKNEGSYLGIFWYLLYPLLMFVIMFSLNGILNNKTIEHFPVYLLTGLIMLNFFRQATIDSVGAISRNAGFIKSIKISYESFILSDIFKALFSHLFEFLILIFFIIYFKTPLLGIIAYIIAFILFFIFTVGLSFILATLGAFINDLSNIWTLVIQILWFSTPIFYIINLETLPLMNKLNPLFYFIQIARDLVIYLRPPNLSFIIIAVSISLLAIIIGLFLFTKYKKRFAEIV